MGDSDTIAAIATPPGRGGIGIVRVSGPRTDEIVVGIAAALPAPRIATLASFHDGEGRVIDHGLVVLFVAPHSYTGETVAEFHGHGGPSVMRLLLARCTDLGARIAEPGEFTKRAFLNGKLDLAQAESVADLIDAATATAARAAARSLDGEFSREIHALVAALTELRVYTEATLDFPEEDIEFLREGDVVARLDALRQSLARVRARAKTGALLRDGLTVVLAGRPNVGKSSLLNCLAREEAAIVTPVPGTTRDPVERRVEIAGIPLTIVDTAGLRETGDEVERIGIERTWSAIARADLALVLVDARDVGSNEEDRAILDRLPGDLPRVVVHNNELANPSPQLAEFSTAFRRFADEILSKRRQEAEMASAALIQQSFFPKQSAMNVADRDVEIEAPKFGQLARLVATSTTILMLDADRLAIMIGDVCGKGIPASLFMAVVVTVLRTAAREETGCGFHDSPCKYRIVP